MVGIICPPPVGIGLTDLPNIVGASGPPGPPSSGTTVNNVIQRNGSAADINFLL